MPCSRRIFIVVLTGLFLATPVVRAQGTDKIPLQVMKALKAKFPMAEIHTWSRETEGDIVVYDIEFRQEGLKFEADIKQDGTIHNWERQVSATDLPSAVKEAVGTAYPRASFKEIMAITAVKNGNDSPEGYEIVLEIAGKKEVEVTFAPDGRFFEVSGRDR